MGDKYITRAELRLEPYGISIEGVDDKYLEVLQDLTKDLVDKFCGQDFEQEGSDISPAEKRISGTGKDTIFLPKRLINLKKVRIYTSTTSYSDYEAANFVSKPKFISWISFDTRFGKGTFPEGTYNIGIIGIWGWSNVPGPIKYLQGRMIQKIVEDGEFANKFSSEKLGDYTYQLLEKEASFLADVELDAIIKRYKVWVNYAVA